MSLALGHNWVKNSSQSKFGGMIWPIKVMPSCQPSMYIIIMRDESLNPKFLIMLKTP